MNDKDNAQESAGTMSYFDDEADFFYSSMTEEELDN